MINEVRFSPTEADYVAAVRANFLCSLLRPKALRNGAIVIGLGAVLGLGVALLDQPGFWAIFLVGGFVYGTIIWVGICLGTFLFVPRRSAQLFRQQRSIHQSFCYRWSAGGLECEFATGSVRTPWPDFRGWRETKPAILLYMNDQLFQFLPRRVLDEETAQTLRASIEHAGVPRY